MLCQIILNIVKSIYKIRIKKGISQRAMASCASLSFRTVQLLESKAHDAKLSTLKNIATALGYPPNIIDHQIESVFGQPADSISMISERILCEGEDSWMIWLFNFVDAFRKGGERAYIELSPADSLSLRMRALIASTVETLCYEMGVKVPPWCIAVSPLKDPWFVSGVENLKASAVAESSIHFRKRNIFVLKNFLERR